jgi:hypothetical protein
VTNNWLHAASILTPQFPGQAGQLETEFLKKARLWVYSSDQLVDTGGLHPYLSSQLRLVALFLNHLWLVRDNAANCNTGFAFMSLPSGEMFASNVLAIHYSTVDGTDNEIAFTREEVRRARGAFSALAFNAGESQAGRWLGSGYGKHM